MKKPEPKIKNPILRFLRTIYDKLVLINDTPQRIALGAGLGVFAGIFPATGPIAALFLAFIFRANRASALLGSLLTNTWMSFVVFIAAIKVGAVVFGIKLVDLKQEWLALLKEFHFSALLKSSALNILLPVFLGYIAIAFLAGLLTYLICLIIVTAVKKRSTGLLS